MIKKFLHLAVMAIVGILPVVSCAEEVSSDALVMQREIKHVVVLMLENRSFDNVLAWLYDNQEAPFHFIPPDTSPTYFGLTDDTLELYTNTLKNAAGEVVYSCCPIKGVPSVATSSLLNSPKHCPDEVYDNVLRQIYGIDGATEPNMSGFLQDFASQWKETEWIKEKETICSIMETYTEKELPVLYGLAREYAVSDHWFCSVPTQTNPNRAFAACGTSEGQVVNGTLGKSAFTADTIWNRLSEQSPDTTWAVFWQADLLPGIFAGPFTGKRTFSALKRIPKVEEHYLLIDKFHELARKGELPHFTFIEPQWTIAMELSPQEEAFPEHPDVYDYVLGLLIGLQGNDFHPPGDVRTAENLLANVYTSLCANPESWKNTLFVVTFDEHGGIWDHVPPPVAIPPDDHCQCGFKFDRYGVRVPTVFISPLIERRTIIRSDKPEIPFDHTSLVATILKWRNVEKSKWNMGKRTDAAPTFDTVLTRSEPRESSVVAPPEVLLPEVEPNNVVHMGDRFYLREAGGRYIAHSVWEFRHLARMGSDRERAPIEFAGGTGKVTHGSFVLIKSDDPALGDNNLLDNWSSFCECVFEHNRHTPGQWWTIKSVDHPFVGSEIQYGDRIYLENHVYLDPFQYIPARLVKSCGFFGDFLSTKEVTKEPTDDHYWIIERSE